MYSKRVKGLSLGSNMLWDRSRKAIRMRVGMDKVPLLVLWRERKMSRLRSLFDISEFLLCFVYLTYVHLTWRIVGVRSRFLVSTSASGLFTFPRPCGIDNADVYDVTIGISPALAMVRRRNRTLWVLPGFIGGHVLLSST